MGINPKTSKKILVWGINSALGLLADYISSKQRDMRQEEVSEYFRNSTKGLGISNRRISRMTYELKRQKYLEVDDGDSVKLTDKAKIKIIDKFTTTSPYDKKRRLISFDIPETKRRQRNGFRRCIKKMGFRQVQKSLWVCNKNIGDMVEIAVREFEIEDYVAYFVIESSNIDKYINKILVKQKSVNKQ